MPTYEYRCRACGHTFERFQKMSDDPVRTCPDCGEEAAERLISSGGGLVFKGSGFYATDYRDPPKKSKKGEKEEGGASGRDGGGKSDGGEGGSSGDDADG